MSRVRAQVVSETIAAMAFEVRAAAANPCACLPARLPARFAGHVVVGGEPHHAPLRLHSPHTPAADPHRLNRRVRRWRRRRTPTPRRGSPRRRRTFTSPPISEGRRRSTSRRSPPIGAPQSQSPPALPAKRAAWNSNSKTAHDANANAWDSRRLRDTVRMTQLTVEMCRVHLAQQVHRMRRLHDQRRAARRQVPVLLRQPGPDGPGFRPYAASPLKC